MKTSWHVRFLEVADLISSWSKDPSTGVGCVIVGGSREIRSTGFNGFPRGISDDERLNDREKKYPIIVHAEENAILNATLTGVTLKDCTAYVTMCPCSRCSRMLIQVGVKRVITPTKPIPERWKEDFNVSTSLLKEAGVELVLI